MMWSKGGAQGSPVRPRQAFASSSSGRSSLACWSIGPEALKKALRAMGRRLARKLTNIDTLREVQRKIDREVDQVLRQAYGQAPDPEEGQEKAMNLSDIHDSLGLTTCPRCNGSGR